MTLWTDRSIYEYGIINTSCYERIVAKGWEGFIRVFLTWRGSRAGWQGPPGRDGAGGRGRDGKAGCHRVDAPAQIGLPGPDPPLRFPAGTPGLSTSRPAPWSPRASPALLAALLLTALIARWERVKQAITTYLVIGLFVYERVTVILTKRLNKF